MHIEDTGRDCSSRRTTRQFDERKVSTQVLLVNEKLIWINNKVFHDVKAHQATHVSRTGLLAVETLATVILFVITFTRHNITLIRHFEF